MLRFVAERALKHRRSIVAFAIVATIAAGWQLRHAKLDALPEFNPPTVEVQTEALGLSAEEVEQYVTVPLEQNFLNGVPFVNTIQSKSLPGLSSVVLTFHDGTSLATARQLVQERLSLTTELPNVSKPPQMLQSVSSTGRVMMIGLSSRTLSPIELSVLARWTIRPRLLGVRGVAEVDIWGQRDQQLQVQVDPRQLASKGVTLDQVITTAGDALFVSPLTFLEASTPGSGGFFDTPSQRLGVQHILPIRSPADLAKVSVVDTSPLLHLGDVATVVQDHQPLIGDAVLNNGPGLLLVVERLPGANTRQVTHDLDAAIATLRPGLAGVTVDSSIYRPAAYIDASMHNLTRAAAAAVCLVFLSLALLLGWRIAVVSVFTVTASVVAAAYVLALRGMALNAMVFAGLALAIGPVLFDAVLVSRRADDDRGSRSLVYGSAITLVAAAPVLFLADLPSHAFLPAIAESYLLAIGAGLVVALVLAPALVHALPSRPTGGTRLGALITRARRPAVATRPLYVGLATLAVAAIGLVSLQEVTPALRPTLRETELLVQFNGAPGTSLDEMQRVAARAASELKMVKGVRDVGGHVGRAVSSDQVSPVSSSELWVALDPNADHAATLGAVQRIVDGYPGLDRHVVSYFNQRVDDLLGPPGPPVVVRLSGEDFDVLNAKAQEIQKVLFGIRGIVTPQVQAQPHEPVIDVQVNLDAAQRAGIKPGDIRRAAATLVSGIDVGGLYQDQKVFQVVVWGTPDVRSSLTSIADLVIDTPAGAHVRLGDVASVKVSPSLVAINHEDVSRTLDVTAQVRGRAVGAVLNDVRRRVRGVSFPLAHNATVVSRRGQRSSQYRRIALVAVVAAVITLLLLQAALASWAAAAVVLLIIPIGLVGGVAAAWADGGTLSLGSVVGLFAVGGIAIRAALWVVGARPESADLVPPLAASIAIGLAFAPFFAIGTLPGTEIVRPMAAVIVGGLITSILATMVALPAACIALGLRRHGEGFDVTT